MWTRRRLIQLGLAGTAASFVLGAVPVVSLDEEVALAALLDALFDPGTGTAPVPSQTDAVAGTLAYVAALPAATRIQVRGLFRALELGPIASHGARFSELDADQRHAWLLGLAAGRYPSRLLLNAIKQIGAVGYYQQRTTWTALAYPGPLVDR